MMSQYLFQSLLVLSAAVLVSLFTPTQVYAQLDPGGSVGVYKCFGGACQLVSCATGSCVDQCSSYRDCQAPDDPDPDPEEYQDLYVQKDGTGTGTVTSSPSGINCGSSCSIVRSSTHQWDLRASPDKGSTFTRWSEPQGTYRFCVRRGGKNNSCTEWTDIPTCGTLSQCRVFVQKDREKTVIATFAGPTLYGVLDASYPPDPVVGSTFTFTARRTGGTATGTVTYTNPRCTRGWLGMTTFAPVSGSYSGTSDRTFACVYNSISNSFSNLQGARMTIKQGGVSRIVAANVTVTEPTAPPPPPTPDPTPTPSLSVSLDASDTLITRGDSSTLTWRSLNAGSCSATSFSLGGSMLNGSTNVSPTADTTYRFTCINNAGDSRMDSATVNVQEPPAVTVDLSASDTSITRGDSSTLTWRSSNADSCTSSDFSTGGSTDGSTNVFPTTNTSYGITCTGAGASDSDNVIVRVQEPAIQNIDASVEPTWVSRGGSTEVTWDIQPPDAGDTATCTVGSSDTTNVVLSPTSPRNYSSGQRLVTASNIQQATRFTVSCTNDTNTKEGYATVYILPSYSEF